MFKFLKRLLKGSFLKRLTMPRLIFRLIVLFLVFFCFLPSQNDITQSRDTAITRAIKRVSPSVASINVIQLKEVTTRSPFNDPFFQDFFPYELHRQKVKSSGSGVVVSPDGYVITNFHVVENALEIIITLPGGEEYKAVVIGTDSMTDLALLKLEGGNFPFATLGNSDELIIGEWVVALGNPYGLFDVNDQPTATAGIISAVNMDFGQQKSGQVFQNMIQTDAAINPGNSGGPLVNSRGEVVGINTFIFTGSTMSQGSIGIGFALPINHAKNIAEELKTKGNIDRSYFTGIQVQPLNQRIIRYLDIPVKSGVIIVEIEKGSPAERAKLKLADIILSVNGIKVKTAEDIKEIILNQDLRSGDELDIKIYRNNQEKTVTMKLGKVKMKSRYW